MASPWTLFKMKKHSTYFWRGQHKPVSRPNEEFSVVLIQKDSCNSQPILCSHGKGVPCSTSSNLENWRSDEVWELSKLGNFHGGG